MCDENQQVGVVAEKILRYLRRRPDAADTVRGIAQWWLGRQQSEETDKLVGKALDRLLREGEVVRIVTPNGNSIYRRRRPTGPARKRKQSETLH